MAGGPEGGRQSDHDLLIRIDERVGEIRTDMQSVKETLRVHGERLYTLEQVPTEAQAEREERGPGFWMPRPMAIVVGFLVLLALGGALTLDLPKAEHLIHAAKSAAKP